MWSYAGAELNFLARGWQKGLSRGSTPELTWFSFCLCVSRSASVCLSLPIYLSLSLASNSGSFVIICGARSRSGMRMTHVSVYFCLSIFLFSKLFLSTNFNVVDLLGEFVTLALSGVMDMEWGLTNSCVTKVSNFVHELLHWGLCLSGQRTCGIW